MNIRLGNILFDQVEGKLGYRLTAEDKKLWDELHDDHADLSGKESCFHIFDTPRCVVVKGAKAKDAIIKMFSPDKIVEAKGAFPAYSL